LKTSNEKIQKLSQKINILEADNRRLSLRGSATFQELTPRHINVKELF
jgi:hypothetical protein